MSEILIFGRKGCPHTEAAIKKAEEDNIMYSFAEIPKCPHSEMGYLFELIAKEKLHNTVPCIFEIKYIGGNSEFQSKY